MCVHTHEYKHKGIQLYLFYLLCVCVWYEYISMQTFLHVFLALGAGYLAVCLSLESASIPVLTLHSAASCSSMATQDVPVLGEFQQDIAHVTYRMFF